MMTYISMYTGSTRGQSPGEKYFDTRRITDRPESVQGEKK